MIHLLVADDDDTNLSLLRIFCRAREDVHLILAGNGQEALRQVEDGQVDVVMTDIRMPVLSGDELLTTLKRDHPHIPVIIMTGYGSIEGAVDYLKRGADDYLEKPLTKEVFIHRLERVMEQVTLLAEVRRLKRLTSSSERLIGRSPQMIALKNQLPTLAQTEASVVIYGESGTGKEVVARSIHEHSRRSDRPFVTVNCGALPESLLEAELFGYKRGAFTDAHADNPGLVGSADTGTLFLDEIGEISLSVQVKLLRFLELKEYKPVGSPQSHIADVRIIAATNRDLKRAVEEKTFREDLFYRLNVVPVLLPALHEREGDISLLATNFLARFNQQFHKEVVLMPAAIRALERYRWPGNIRELENKIEQIVVMANTDRAVGSDDIQLGHNAEPPESVSRDLRTFKEEKQSLLKKFEREYLTTLLEQEQGHLTRAAERAGLNRKNLWQLMKRHGLSADEFKDAKR